MAKIKNPIRFSEHFGIDVATLVKAGVMNPTLNADTRLFIDPLLLEESGHSEMSVDGRQAYLSHFDKAIALLRAVRTKDHSDTYWRNVHKLLSFPEIKGTCLGYGAESISGSGSGAAMTGQVLKTAKDIVDLGVQNPDLFVAMALFEDNFGPDRISDMTTNIIFDALLKFNARILPVLKVAVEDFEIRLKNGETYQANLPRNPCAKGKVPVILVPSDILRDLPVATSWSDIAAAASRNAAIRQRVNKQVSQLWRSKTLKDKSAVRKWAMQDRASFETLLKMIQEADHSAYDMKGDPRGELFWRQLLTDLAHQQPFKTKQPAQLDLPGVGSVVEQIIEQFRFLIEDRRFSEELYCKGVPRPEKAAQMLFFAAAHSYCKANNLDLTPEAETGTGPVDFKVASGFKGRVLVEMKLSTNKKLLHGYSRQLAAYQREEETEEAYYVVIDVGGLIAKKKRALARLRQQAVETGKKAPPIIFINGLRQQSASKR